MKSNLKSSLKRTAIPAADGPASPPRAVRAAPHEGKDGRPHRAGKRMLGAHVDEGLYIAVRRLAADYGVTMQEMVHRAFNELLEKHKGARA